MKYYLFFIFMLNIAEDIIHMYLHIFKYAFSHIQICGNPFLCFAYIYIVNVYKKLFLLQIEQPIMEIDFREFFSIH